MLFLVLFLVCLAFGVFIYLKHKQTQRDIAKRERLEEKQEQIMELLRDKKLKGNTNDEVLDGGRNDE